MGAALVTGTLAGWLVLSLVSLIGPRLGHGRAGSLPAGSGSEPPAVLSLLAGRPDRDGLAATLVALSGRGWFSLTRTACVLPAETPIENLTIYERRAVEHVAKRTGAHRETPPEALLDGFAGGEEEFMKAFRAEVIAESRARGLSRPTFSGARKALLCILALIPARAMVIAAHPGRQTSSLLPLAGFYYVILCVAALRLSSERLTRAGQAVLAARESELPAMLGSLSGRSDNAAWSGYGDSWRLVPIGSTEERMWPGISGGAFTVMVLLFIPGVPVFGIVGFVLAGGHGAELGVLAAIAADVALTARAIARYSHMPQFAEFDGLVIRQWQTGSEKDEDGVSYFAAVDDGTSPQAWAFPVSESSYGSMPPGTLVHVRANPRMHKLLGIERLRQLPVAPLLAPPGDPRA
jgi:hypothetical protein